MGFASRPHDLCCVTSSPASAKLRGGGNRSHPLLPDPKSSPCPKPFWTHFGQLNANPAAAAQFQDSAPQFSEYCPLGWLFLSLCAAFPWPGRSLSVAEPGLLVSNEANICMQFNKLKTANIFGTPDRACIRNTRYYQSTRWCHYWYLHSVLPGSKDLLVVCCWQPNLFSPQI